MANYNSTANVVLSVNGRQAEQMLSKLQKEAKALESRLAKAANAGDKASMKKLQRELTSTNNIIKQLQGSAKTAEQVLGRLDKSSPKELGKTLRTLQQQMNGIQRGSKAWDAHAAKIRAVKAEIAKLNASLATQKSLWSRMNVWLNNCQTALIGIVAGFSGLVMAGRKAVNAFAQMDEEMANSVKYTRMTREQVGQLNENFKKIDTRLAREQLNELAQEAGRLGKNTLDSVQGYVEAAQIINVALVDLGDGATQTIAKLTNIFGVDQLLGTKDAMLAVGSTVNVLSQNCTASKPYLVDFAQRMAGIGSQAGLTIPQILAFGAVLDANGQKVEMSATAIQKVIMKLAQKNREFAQTLGLDAELLNATLKSSAKDGLMMFLQALHDIGESSDYNNATMVLAPAFNEMGLDAARVSQVLSTLAKHIDEIKWQLGEADKAFQDASSATNEFNIFNNTAQASIDKAKNRVHELAIELGEKLHPLMKHIYTSSGIFLRVLNNMAIFFIEHKKSLLTIAAALIAYNSAVTIHNARVAIASKAATLWCGTMKMLQVLLAPARILIAGLVNTIQYFTNGLEANCAMQQRWQKALKGMSFANWAGIAVAAIAAVVLAWEKLSGKVDKFRKSMVDGIGKMSSFDSETRKEKEAIDKLFGTLKGARKESEEYKKAKDQILNQYGKYLQGIIDERGEITNLEDAYRRLADAIRIANQERGIKNAKDAIEQTFQQEMNELSSQLYQTLLDYGCNIQEAAKLQAAVVTSLQMGVPVDMETKSRIDELAKSGRVSVDGKSGWGSKLKYNTSGALDALTGGLLGSEFAADPAALVNRMHEVSSMRSDAVSQVDATARLNRPLRDLDDTFLNAGLEYAKRAKDAGGTVMRVLDALAGTFEMVEVSAQEAQSLYMQYSSEMAYRQGSSPKAVPESHKIGEGADESNADNNASTDKFAKEKDWRTREEAQARIDFAIGESDYLEYTKRMDQIAVDYYSMLLEHAELSVTERLAIEADYYEAVRKQTDHANAQSLEAEQASYSELVSQAKQFYIDGEYSKETYDFAIQRLEIEHQKNIANLTAKGSKERIEAEKRLTDLLVAERNHRQKQFEDLEKKYAAVKEEYFGDNASERQAKFEADFEMLKIVYEREIVAAGDNAEERLRIEEAFQKAKLSLQKKYGLLIEQDARNTLQRSVEKSIEWLNGDGGKAVIGAIETLVSGMSAIFSQLSTLMQAELEIQTAEINKRYDAEVSRAEGNSYQVKKIEEQRQKELTKAKNEANRKMFAMQVIQAVAQTAQGAISAYSSAAAVPVIGWLLAPIAAGMALAAGAIQIAAIKKQQLASQAQGYSQGGFTPGGEKDEPVGIVHAGEWVASQKLTHNPKTRPLLEALDKAQRNNTIGSLTSDAVSYLMPATAGTTQGAILQSPQPNVIVNVPPQQGDKGIGETLARLNERLGQPFVTVNTVSGDHGIQQAQDEYDRLMKNKSPKSRK